MIKRTQEFLNKEGFDCGDVDGIAGSKTFTAIDRLIEALRKPRVNMKGDMRLIYQECNMAGFTRNQTAYVMATVEHETNATFKPVKEAYWLSEEWRKRNLRYYGRLGYFGRGYVQITWEENYKKYSKILGVDLVGNPDLALEPQYAAKILVDGFKYGRFTGKRLSEYVNSNKCDFKNARRCINGLDKANHIAKLARKYQ